MLLELRIKDFAIIEELSLEFQKGMTVLTGETGAGKSIIIDAVGLLAGGRGSVEFVRHGAKKCSLEGQFQLNKTQSLKDALNKYEIDVDDSVLYIQREIFASGRTVCRVNGSIVTISALKEIGSNLIDIHGQNEHQELMNPETHVHMLDYFGKDTIFPLLNDYQQIFNEYKTTKKELDNIQTNEQESSEKIDVLQFRIREIEEAALQENEDVLLEEEANKLSNFQTIMEALQKSYESLQGEEQSGLEIVGVAMEQLETIASLDENFNTLYENISNTFYQLQEYSSDIYRELDNLEFDEERLNEIELRLDLIQQLKRKYGQSIDEILQYYNESIVELDKLENREFAQEDLINQVDKLAEELLAKGNQLSQARQKSAKDLEAAIQEQLAALYMDKVVFEVSFKEKETKNSLGRAGRNGLDTVEFYISTNPGEPLKPLTKIASGGELSRIMLALKTIFSNSQGITSIIFDEVDTGVSGRVAQSIADKIYSVAVHSQVLCISHLPQVAAMADQHLYISKQIEKERTLTHVENLSNEGKTSEVARMLAGTEITPAAKEAAKELRLSSEKKKAGSK